ncbi:MAG: TMEM175 family protein [Methanobrevibacter sp.]|nr:TMEM175 family protein [Methanobrevibacter sp.]
MEKNRLESFSDGVLAIIITIMVLQLGIPTSAELSAIYPIIPVFLGYVLSFMYVGIYWNNHHHLLKALHTVSGKILLVNLVLLFWVSLMPFTTAWMAENHFEAWPTVFYGIVLAMASLSYYFLQREIIKVEGEDSDLKKAIGHRRKEKISFILYIVAISLALMEPHFSQLLYLTVALIWIIPDRRIEKILE